MSELVSQVHALEEDGQIDAITSILEGITLGTCVKLVKHLEDKWDVEAKPDYSGFAPPAEEVEEVEQSEFSVVVSSIGAKKIAVIKVVRVMTGLNLKDAKGILDKGVPALIKEKVSKDEAEQYKKQLEEAGASAEIK
jgi:large subunit ribosomal protein L7/L12